MSSLRAAGAEDAAAMARLEARAVAHAWSERQYRDSLSATHQAWLLEHQHRLIGLIVVMLTLDEAEILNLVIDPDDQGRGLGRSLLEQALIKLAQQGATRVLLEVRQSNSPARALYQQAGFIEIGLRKNYYPTVDGREHAILMEKAL